MCVVWWDFAANFFVEHGALRFFVVAGVVVGVNDLERAHVFLVEGDAEGSSFFNLLNVAACYVVEVLWNVVLMRMTMPAFCLSLWLQKASKPSMGVQAASFPSVECVS